MPNTSTHRFFIVLIAALMLVALQPQSASAADVFPVTPVTASTLGWTTYTTRGNSANPANAGECIGCVPSGVIGLTAAVSEIQTGVGTPPSGTGSLRLETGNGTGGGGVTGRGGRPFASYAGLNGVLLSDIQRISYYSYVEPGSPANLVQAINLFVDLGADGNAFTYTNGSFPATNSNLDALLVFEAVYNLGDPGFPATVAQGAWVEWVITPTQGLWWDVRNNAATNAPCGGLGGCQTLGEVAANYPNARVYGFSPAQQAITGSVGGNTLVGGLNNGFVLSGGSSGGAPWVDWSSNVDLVNFQVTANAGLGYGAMDASYDFEPADYQLVFTQQPTNTVVNDPITPAITVEIQDSAGTLITSATNTITLSISTNPGGGVLAGTTAVNAVNGVATFSGLSINAAGNGYTLDAAGANLTATSAAFDITGLPVAAFGSVPAAPGPINLMGASGSSASGEITVSNTGDPGSALAVTLGSISAGYTITGLPITGLTPTDSAATLTVSCTVPQSSGTLVLFLNTVQEEVAFDLTCAETVVTTGGGDEERQILQPEELGITRLPLTGETPFWADFVRAFVRAARG